MHHLPTRWLHSALGRNLTDEASQDIIIAAYHPLVQDYPILTPKSLDRLTWHYQRGR